MGACNSTNEAKQNRNTKKNQNGASGNRRTKTKMPKLVQADLDESINMSERGTDERESILRRGQTKELQQMLTNIAFRSMYGMPKCKCS